MNQEGSRGPGLRSIARGIRRLLYVVLFMAAEAFGLFLLIEAPDSPGHMERVGGVLMMVLGVAPFLLGPIDELYVLRDREWREDGRAPEQPPDANEQEAVPAEGRKVPRSS
jgi:hypothetical protein